MRFTKMQGAGNDYVYINGFQERVSDPSSLAVAVSDRHFGIGADGLVLILPSEIADVRMRMFNADGSEAQMCGNAIRCVAKYAWDHGLTAANPMRIQTEAGIKEIQVFLGADGWVNRARVNMGTPILDGPTIPIAIAKDRIINEPIASASGTYTITGVSMGNPHVTIYVDDVAKVDLERVGPELERHPLFPQRMNVHFVQIGSPSELTMRTWERGSGITLACGTGASAVCVAGVLTGRSQRKVLIHLYGGDLELEWNERDNRVYMTGPAVEVFSGDWPG